MAVIGSASQNVVILSPPRSGSSALAAALVRESGRRTVEWPSPERPIFRKNHDFNPDGYFEDVGYSLVFDQLLRFIYGTRHSFLLPPAVPSLLLEAAPGLPENPSYDLTSKTVDIPEGYEDNPFAYTGVPWDSWGITRMLGGGKWERAYSRYRCDTLGGAKSAFEKLSATLSVSNSFLLKDPRLLFLASFLPESVAIIFIQRDTSGWITSMKRHYGPRLFDGEPFPGKSYVSNHFNHQVPAQSAERYLESVRAHLDPLLESRAVLKVRTEDVGEKSLMRQISAWLGSSEQHG